MSHNYKGPILLASLLTTPVPYAAYSAVYLTEEQAHKAIFPGVELAQKDIELFDAEKKAIEAGSGISVRDSKLKIYRGPHGETLFIDRVVGKHDFITYAVGIKDGRVVQVEILEYRESYGSEVRRPEWRHQFAGKSKDAKLKIKDDIQNISGATLSSTHVTAGVKRILFTYDTIKSRLE